MSTETHQNQAGTPQNGWHERNPQRDPDPRIRAAYRDLYPSQSEDIATGGGYNEDSDGPTTAPGGSHPRRTVEDPAERSFLASGGWGVCDAKAGYDNPARGGITFREPEPDEFYVDPEELQILLEQRLGFAIDAFRQCWVGTGRRSTETKTRADRIAIRLARLAGEGELGVVRLAELMDVNRRSLHRAITRGRALLEAQEVAA